MNELAIMEKRLYIVPLTEVMNIGSDVIMGALGSISETAPKDPFAAPARKADVF